MWITICFDTYLDFCNSTYCVNYDGCYLEVKRGSRFEQHNLFVETIQRQQKKANEAAFRFLSELAWLFNTKVKIYGCMSGSGKPLKFLDQTKRCFNRIGNSIDLRAYKQVASNDRQKLALGIYREAISSDSFFYSYLCYFKIINIGYHSGPEQKKWITENIQKVADECHVVSHLRSQNVTDFADHLYKSGRCAIAHASIKSADKIADPNDFDDNYRISRELPLIKELAEYFIKEELKIPSKFEALKQ